MIAADEEVDFIPDVEANGSNSAKLSAMTSSKKANAQITLEWLNICYKTDGENAEQQKTLIHPMSGRAAPGEMLAIMGTSGAGKVRKAKKYKIITALSLITALQQHIQLNYLIY
jgi:ABC-type glutathione transport system ATPase component